ncbi:uncharacterized protein LOC132755907 [Ruditapes philippinarum]|uniref:uncharacterized protein LOC132755907 n=1 Tax=Ruditapes philippinarum TaxID=129788 RepID=UPI00295B2156|nr:uncharacterized protein LOC132755907 [Ruditapes philippinarum]
MSESETKSDLGTRSVSEAKSDIDTMSISLETKSDLGTMSVLDIGTMSISSETKSNLDTKSESESKSDITSEKHLDNYIHEASVHEKSESEAVVEKSEVVHDSDQSETIMVQEKKEEVKAEVMEKKEKVTKSSEDRTEDDGSLRFRAHFCELCQQSFTRAQSLSRHNARKHTTLKEPINRVDVGSKRTKANMEGVRAKRSNTSMVDGGAKRTKTRKMTKYIESFSEESDSVENNDTIEKPTEKKTRSLKIRLSSKFQTAKNFKDNSGESSVGKLDENSGGTQPMLDEEIAAIHALKDSCDKLESAGQQVLVITSNGDHAQWFGSKYGVQFAQDNSEVIGSFFNYCKEKEEAWKQEMKITIKSEGETIDDVEMGGNVNNTNGLTGDDEKDDSDGGGDDDDNDNDDYHEKVEEYDDEDDTDERNDDNKHGKNVFRSAVARSKAVRERRDGMFKDIAENLSRNENSRDASIVVRRKNGVRIALYTVEDLNRGQYKCALCGYNFLWKCHLELHQIKNPYCNKTKHLTRSENDVLKESITFTDTKTGVEVTSTFQELLDSQTVDPISCAVCSRSGFKGRGKLKEHLILHNESSIFECNVCCAGFTTVGFLSAHLKEHFKKSYECHSCHWRFTTGQKLKQHTDGGCRSVSLISYDDKNDLDAGLDNVTFSCNVCLSEVTGLKNLRKHLSSDHDKQFGINDCVLCNKQFSVTSLFNRHMLCHKSRYSCPYCPKTFSEKSNLFFYHLKSHRNLSEFPYVCDICGKKFKSKRHFDPHRRIHTGERPYKCKVEGCGKAFRSADGLDQHKWCHVNQHFICDFCGRKFKKPSLLNNHRQTHTQEWRYPCIYCELKFRKLRPYKRHLAQVHPTKVEDVKERFKIILHPCTDCPKVFFDKEDHTAHINRHRGIRPFSCKFCNKTFGDKSNLMCHVKLHEGGKKLKCKFCPRRFNIEKFLEDHVARLHNPKSKVSDENRESDDNHDDQDDDDGQRLTIALSDNEEDIDQLRESTLQIIDETIRRNVSFD